MACKCNKDKFKEEFEKKLKEKNSKYIHYSANSELKEYYLRMCDGLTEAEQDFNKLWEEHTERDEI